MQEQAYKKTKEEKAYLTKSNKLRNKFESSFRKEVELYLARVKNNVLNAFNQHNEGFVLANMNELIKDDEFTDAIIDNDINLGLAFADFTNERLNDFQKTKKAPSVGLSVNFFSETWRKQMQEYALLSSSKLITLIDETTRARVRESLADSANKGYGADKTANALKKSTAFSRKRAVMIARTETTAGQEYGSYLGAKPYAKRLKKKWLTAQDGRVRDTHASMNGKEVKFDDNFSVDGLPMKYPCDPNGGKQNVINCRCTCLYVPDRTIEDEPQVNNDNSVQLVNDNNAFYSLLAGLLVNEVVN